MSGVMMMVLVVVLVPALEVAVTVVALVGCVLTELLYHYSSFTNISTGSLLRLYAILIWPPAHTRMA